LKTLPAAITAGKVGNSERVILVRIMHEVYELRYATKDITITAWEGGVDSKVFVGNVLAQGKLGVISQSVDLEEGGNIAKVSGLILTILNPEYTGSNRFDQYMSTYVHNLENREVEIRLVFWTGSNPAWSDTLLLYKGVVDDVDYDYLEYKIKVKDAGSKRHKNIPDLVLTEEDYPSLPDYNKDKIVPLLFGALGGAWYDYNIMNFSPMIKTDKNKLKYIVCRNKAYSIEPTYLYVYFSEINRWGRIFQTTDLTATSGRPSMLEFNVDEETKTSFYSQPEGQGKQTSPSSLDFKNAIDDSSSSYFTLGASEKLYVRIPIPSEFARIQNEANNLELLITTGAITGTGTVKYYNPEWADGVGGFSTGQGFTVADANDYITYSFGNDKSAHGRAGDQSDQNDSWTFDEMTVYEFGIECNAASSIQIKNIVLKMKNMFLKILIIHKEGRAPRRRGTGKRDWPKEQIDFTEICDNLFIRAFGAEFGAWIDQDSRDNGFNSGDLVQYAAYPIESILRDELDLTSSEINYEGFDIVGNATNGHRKAWDFASLISAQKNSMEIIKDFCRQCAIIFYQNYENKETVKALKKSTTVKTINRTTIQDGEFKSIEFSSLSKVYNEFYLRWQKEYANDGFKETLFVTASDHNLSSNVRAGTPNTYTGLCADSQDKYLKTNRLTLDCDWIRDTVTAEYLIKWFAEWLCYRKHIPSFKTDGLDHIELELGDQVKIDHTLLPAGVSNDDSFLLFDIKHDLSDDKIGFRFIQIPDLLP